MRSLVRVTRTKAAEKLQSKFLQSPHWLGLYIISSACNLYIDFWFTFGV